MIARVECVVLDCPDPRALAAFYAEILGMQVTTERDNHWVVVKGDGQPAIAFQYAPDLRRPVWPDPQRPQQFHLDLYVDDATWAEQQVLALGATRLPGDGDDFRVYADPVGHPFCLVTAHA